VPFPVPVAALLLVPAVLLGCEGGTPEADPPGGSAGSEAARPSAGGESRAPQVPAHLRGTLLHLQDARQAEATGDLDAAAGHYVRALELAPRHPALHFSMAALEARRGEVSSSLASLERVAALGGAYDVEEHAAFGILGSVEGFAEVAERLRSRQAPWPSAEVVAVLEERQLWPEGIAHDPVTGDLFLGSLERKIVRLRSGGEVSDLVAEGMMEVLGMEVDVEQRHLWAVMGEGPTGLEAEEPRRNAVVQVELGTGRLLATYPLAADGRNRILNDLTLAPDGRVFVTDSNFGGIYRLEAGGTLELFVELPESNYLNGITVAPGGGRIYVTHLEGLTAIELDEGGNAGPAVRVAAGDDLFLGHGDGLCASGDSLIVVQNMPFLANRVARIRLDASGLRAVALEALDAGLPEGLLPYTCATHAAADGRNVLYLSSAADFQLRDEGETPPHPVVARVDLG
ncbi:MAG: hypothetical protein MI919_16850, partial [Holophagales bacterium]|nr:hypothetical protein [Holophagales bacterium]